MVRVGRGVWGLGLYLTLKEVYVLNLSLLLCLALKPNLVLVSTFPRDRVKWGASAEDGGGGC